MVQLSAGASKNYQISPTTQIDITVSVETGSAQITLKRLKDNKIVQRRVNSGKTIMINENDFLPPINQPSQYLLEITGSGNLNNFEVWIQPDFIAVSRDENQS